MTAKTTLVPVLRKRLHEDIVLQLQKQIIAGEIEAGKKLPPERDLAAAFKVNRATIREALKKLELLSLVDIRHGDGVYVKNYLESGNLELLNAIVYMDREVNSGVIKDLLVIRRIITPEMAALAAGKIKPEGIAAIEYLIANETDIQKRDMEIHSIIAREGGNLFYVFVLNFFNRFIEQYGFLYFTDEENIEKSAVFHSRILESLRQRDPEKSRKIMKDVLVYTENRILNKLNIAGGKNDG